MDRPGEDVELLVHIAAPATTVSDEVYRQLARAAMGFIPLKTTTLPDAADLEISSSLDVVEDSFAEEPSKRDGAMQAAPVQCTSLAGSKPHQFGNTGSCPSAALSGTSEPAQRENVGEDIEDSSCIHVVACTQEDEKDDDSIIEEVPDSYPVGDVMLDPFVSPTRMLEHHLRRIKSAPPPPKRALGSEEDRDRPLEVSGAPQKAAKTYPGQTRRPLPSSPRNGTPDSSPMIAVDTNIVLESPPIYDSPVEVGDPTEITSSSQAPTTSSQNGELRQGSHDTTKQKTVRDTPLRRYQSDQGVKKNAHLTAPVLTRSMSAPSSAVSPEVLESYKRKFTALEVFPPEPQVSVDYLDESSLLTPHLRKLAKDVPLEQVYRPEFYPSKAGVSSAKSDLRPLQRGYWLLDMSTWDESSRWTTWARLHESVSQGAAGWRVWCLRDEACVRIRTYGWASLAGHVYLFVNEASGGRVRCVDMKWIGDDRRPRISVPAAMGGGASRVQ